ncbi:vWA domain-containing protein [Mesohalobacter halotolerans]|uniref:VWA domain-containing protein n=1 Tax=Mesohalobacter halotolerans TaxID=1883405 RepID=A0A4U5TSB8_9FLAO|nr:VWA domain-containing protein [Mesohalobacter halotolerans]MBS3739096.1 VWA domain-containing protein [Psychroflexus sp.]TKS57016.1 VWA domain-containing protein [Mesohalobacter halotolerans]
MIQFENPYYFWYFAVVGVIVLLFVVYRLWQTRAQKRFADPKLFKFLAPQRSAFKLWIKFVFLTLGLSCFIIALANPKMGTKMETVKRQGVDIVFALDVSKSMLAEDIAPNRLEKSKQIISQTLNNLVSDRVGIIGYAGSAFPQIPITTDYGAAKTFLQAMNTDMVSSQGTAVADAIDMASTYYDRDDTTNRVLIIVGDGEDHGSKADDAIERAVESNIRIFTIGVGTSKGGPIPIKQNRGVTYKKDQNGQTVITRADKMTLQNIAEKGNGAFIDKVRTDEIVKSLLENLQKIEKSEFETKQFSDFKTQYQWFIGFGMLFILLDVLILERKTQWLRRLNLFNEKDYDEEI